MPILDRSGENFIEKSRKNSTSSETERVLVSYFFKKILGLEPISTLLNVDVRFLADIYFSDVFHFEDFF